MSRNLLHKSKLEEFKLWLAAHSIVHRPGRVDFQVLQIHTKNGQWQCIFYRIEAPEHFTVARPIEQLVRRFIRETKEACL